MKHFASTLKWKDKYIKKRKRFAEVVLLHLSTNFEQNSMLYTTIIIINLIFMRVH